MAAAMPIGSPGSKYGPCVDEACGHRDCRFSRMQAAVVCPHCREAIGYSRQFYTVDSPSQLAHASCLEDYYESLKQKGATA